MSISGIYSLSNEAFSNTDSELSTSYVKLELKNGVSTAGVMPGDDILMNPKINNLGAECYIRAKITYIIDGQQYNELDYIDGDYKTWTKEDEYYYYDSVLEKNQEINLFDIVHLPANIDDDDYGKTGTINILVEAVQARNFDKNWDDVVIEEAIENSYPVESDEGFKIVFKNNTKEDINVDDGFWDNLNDLLPGDSISDKVTIKNNNEKDSTYYFSILTEGLTNDEINLLKNINLKITNSAGDILSEDKLINTKNINLGTYTGGDGDDIHFKISLPTSLDNRFSKLIAKITLVFSRDGGDSEEEHQEEPQEEEKEPIWINPKTWDLQFDLSIIIFLLSAAGLIVVMFLERKENINIEKNKEGRI